MIWMPYLGEILLSSEPGSVKVKTKVSGCNHFYNAFSECDRQVTLTTTGMLHFLFISKQLNLLLAYYCTEIHILHA